MAEESPSGTSGTYYLPYAVTAPRDVGYVIRTEREATSIVREVRSALAELDGMLAYLVTHRTREIGVRLAVGSTPRAIVGLLLREGLGLAVAGVGIGAAASMTLGRLLASYLCGVAPSDPWVIFLTTATLGGVAILAGIVPARRAAHIDVMRILNAP